jgi:hypothetical protein
LKKKKNREKTIKTSAFPANWTRVKKMWPLQTVHLLEILLLTLCFQATKPAADVQQKRNVLGPNLPKPEPLLGAGQPDTNLPIFPERPDAVYFIVAVKGGAKTWSRTLARTLLDMGAPFGSPQGPPLRPIYIDLPQNGRWVILEYVVGLNNL